MGKQTQALRASKRGGGRPGMTASGEAPTGGLRDRRFTSGLPRRRQWTRPGSEGPAWRGPYHVLSRGGTRLTQELEEGAGTAVGVSGTLDAARSVSLSR